MCLEWLFGIELSWHQIAHGQTAKLFFRPKQDSYFQTENGPWCMLIPTLCLEILSKTTIWPG